LRLDADEHLVDYDFIKRTCGQGVGAAGLLTERLGGQSVAAILAIDPATFAVEAPSRIFT
jgi:hypothetical protein